MWRHFLHQTHARCGEFQSGGWTEPKLCARTENPAFGLGLPEIPAYQFFWAQILASPIFSLLENMFWCVGLCASVCLCTFKQSKESQNWHQCRGGWHSGNRDWGWLVTKCWLGGWLGMFYFYLTCWLMPVLAWLASIWAPIVWKLANIIG